MRRQGSVVERVLNAFGSMVRASKLRDFDAECADHAAAIRGQLESKGTPIGLADLLIAATARRHGCTLVTHNTPRVQTCARADAGRLVLK